MGLFDWFKQLFFGQDKLDHFDRAYRQGARGADRDSIGRGQTAVFETNAKPPDSVGDLDELASRLGMSPQLLQAIAVDYHTHQIPKKKGGHRTISAPDSDLKRLQRRILRRLLGPLKAHRSAVGFEKGESIVTHAKRHTDSAVVICMDIRQFFDRTESRRVEMFWSRLGWSGLALEKLVQWTCHEGGLPQGAPTSPRLSNLVNFTLDARLAGLAHSLDATYSRYADDLAFSLPVDGRESIAGLIGCTKRILAEHGYTLHQKKKLHIRRRHQRQTITGLVVNDQVALPRAQRRWLRAVAHRQRTSGKATLSPEQLAGWEALQKMVREQAA